MYMNTSTSENPINKELKILYPLKQRLERCDRLFLEHQVSLMHGDFETAQMRLEQVYEMRQLHLQIMEELLLPLYEEIQVEPPKGGRTHYFIREKKLILREFSKFIRINSDVLLNASHKKADIVFLFEDYVWLRDLLDHHDAREKAFLFPVLEDKLDSKRCNEIATIIETKFTALEKESANWD